MVDDVFMAPAFHDSTASDDERHLVFGALYFALRDSGFEVDKYDRWCRLTYPHWTKIRDLYLIPCKIGDVLMVSCFAHRLGGGPAIEFCVGTSGFDDFLNLLKML